MRKSTFLAIAICFTIGIVCCDDSLPAGEAPTGEVGLPDYPRIEQFKEGRVRVDFPTVESWPDFLNLQAWLPVEVTLADDPKPWVGSVHLSVFSELDFDRRTVEISDPEILEIRFSGREATDIVSRLVSQTFSGGRRIVPLDVILRLLPEDFEIPLQTDRPGQLNLQPPEIVISTTPLQLLSIDGNPVTAPVESTGLEYVVNTNWHVFYHSGEETWYVLNGGVWQKNNYLADGGWITSTSLPAGFDTLSTKIDWPQVQQALPARLPDTPPIPFKISQQPTELVVLDGSQRLRTIDGTAIRYVSNTQSDLFLLEDSWYLLISGRWFRSTQLDGQWQPVAELPGDFAIIPADHEKSHVLYSVPGTRQARFALIEAALPRRSAIDRGSVAQTQVGWAGEPRFETIEGTSLKRGINTPYQVIQHNNFFYLCFEGAWYMSDVPTGPWQVALQVPDEIYRIPATDPAYNVTFVKLDEGRRDTEDTVFYSYTGGYTGSFSTRISVVYGTGWYYPSSVYWGAGRNAVYWRHMPTYGYNTIYHPFGGFYPGLWGYAPYYRSTIYVESPTVDYTHGFGSAWEGPYQTTPGDPTKGDNRSLEQFLPARRVEGNEAFTRVEKPDPDETVKVTAASLYAGTSFSSGLFAGPGGEVYRRDDEDWQQYHQGNWTTMQAIDQENRPVVRTQRQRRTEGYERFLPAHKRTLSRSELDRQELARLEGMDNYAKHRMSRMDDQ